MIATGAALGFTPIIGLGFVVVALALRYRKQPAVWEYFCFLALALAIVALGGFAESYTSYTSPLIGAIPLMLSYVLQYLDERKTVHAGIAEGNLKKRASVGNPRVLQIAECPTPAKQVGTSNVPPVKPDNDAR